MRSVERLPCPHLSSFPRREIVPTYLSLFAHFATLLPLGMAMKMRMRLPPLILRPVTYLLETKLVSF